MTPRRHSLIEKPLRNLDYAIWDYVIAKHTENSRECPSEANDFAGSRV